ncbi:hypothetical protein ANCCEY_14429 [Ancylostoma ceylanicum]|uniref:Uncharacterized protein n=1 Tax=Ancylostoma ceylanicum TaxID=53326 RepID=A0A0D6L549_9BILA|nr:hypothetical protein ANCCEY_14429 [Ancylostoma ceylanicum]
MDIGRRLEEVYKGDAPVRVTDCKWHSKKPDGVRFGLAATGRNPVRIKTLKLAVALVMSQIMVVRRLKFTGKARKLSRCVPHALMQYGMDRCADMSLSAHTLKHTHRLLEYPFTMDDK